jgi:uncharacterized protein (TIGR02246 family)
MISRSPLPALCLCVAAFVQARAAAADDQQQKDEAAVRELVTAFERASNRHDATAFAAVFALDCDFTNVRGMTGHGRKAVEEFHRPLFEGDTSKGNPSFKDAVLKIDEVKVRFVRPDVASVDIFWTQTGSVAPDGKDRGTRKGLATWLVTRENGIWHVAVMHNMDLPVKSPGPAIAGALVGRPCPPPEMVVASSNAVQYS